MGVGLGVGGVTGVPGSLIGLRSDDSLINNRVCVACLPALSFRVCVCVYPSPPYPVHMRTLAASPAATCDSRPD